MQIAKLSDYLPQSTLLIFILLYKPNFTVCFNTFFFLIAEIFTTDNGGCIGLLILLVYTASLLVVEMYSCKEYFRCTFVISPSLLVCWSGMAARIYLEKGIFFNSAPIAMAGIFLSVSGLVCKLYLTAVENAKQNCK